jgi:integrase
MTPATVNREVACLRKLLAFAVEQGELDVNPIAGIKLFSEAAGRIPKFEPEDERLLLAALPVWMQRVVRIAILTGCRQGEILALRWRHVDFKASTLTIEDSKSGESRRVPMHPALAMELKERRGTPNGFVVSVVSGDPPTEHSPEAHSVSQAFRRAVRKMGRPDLRFHDLRHVAGSRLLATGASLPEVAATLGHKTLAMSKRYTHVSPVRLASLIAAMPAPAQILDSTVPSSKVEKDRE